MGGGGLVERGLENGDYFLPGCLVNNNNKSLLSTLNNKRV